MNDAMLSHPAIAISGQEGLGSLGSIGILLGVIGITVLLYLERPPITRRTILSMVPWMIAASTIPILTSMTTYPPVLRPFVETGGGYLSTYLMLGTAWFAMLELTVDPEFKGVLPDYLGAMGIGLATVMTTLIILRGDHASIVQIGWSVIIIFGVAVFAIAAVFMLGFWYVEAPTHTGTVGILAVFGQTLDAVTRVVGIEVFQTASHSSLSWRVLDIVAGLQPGATPGDLVVSWTVTYVWIKAAIGVLAVILLAKYTARHPERGYLILGIVATLGVIAGMTNLLYIAIGGPP